MTVLIAAAVFIATTLQAITSARDAGNARRAAVDWWDAEDALVAEQPRRRRWRTRRELRGWRDPVTRRDIAHVQAVLVSWVILTLAALATVIISAVQTID